MNSVGFGISEHQVNTRHRIFTTGLASVYSLCLAEAEKKGRLVVAELEHVRRND
jgi:hypothetical protein